MSLDVKVMPETYRVLAAYQATTMRNALMTHWMLEQELFKSNQVKLCVVLVVNSAHLLPHTFQV